MNWLYYLAEANLYLGIFYLCYCMFLNKETHYTLNRMYLLFSCVLSFILPVVQVGFLKPAAAFGGHALVKTAVITANTIVSKGQIIIPFKPHFTLQDGVLYSYLLGAAVLLVALIIKLYQLFKLTQSKLVAINNGYRLIYITDTDAAFSFFNYLFIGTNTAQQATVIKHELVHIRQKHSVDIILLEMFKIVNWFNPLIYFLQSSLKAVHEYIADQQTISDQTDAATYSDFLLNNAYGVSGFSITHSFFNYNLLKSRIIMLNQKPSGNLARLKYLALLPLCVVMLGTSTLSFSKTYGWIDLLPSNAQSADIAKTDTIKKAEHMQLPPPVIIKDGYGDLSTHITQTLQYPPKAKRAHYSGMVAISFDIDKNKMVSNVKVLESAGHGFDEVALKAVQSYKKTISATPGNYKIGVGFYSIYSSVPVNVSQKVAEAPEYVGYTLIVDEIPAEFKN